MKHVIVEHESAYLFYRDKYPSDEIQWYTTSPSLLERLPQSNENIRSLEEDISFPFRKNLGNISIDFAKHMANYLNEACETFSQGMLVGRVIERDIQQSTFMFLYKLTLLINWHQSFDLKIHELIVVGNPELTSVNNFSLKVGRFDNLFATLAKEKEFFSEVNLQEYISNSYNKETPLLIDSKLKKNERFLSLINHGVIRIFYVFYDRLQRKNILKDNFVKWNRINSIAVFFFKPCDLMLEMRNHLFLKRVKVINYWEQLKNLTSQIPPQSLEVKSDELIHEAIEHIRTMFSRYNLEFTTAHENAIKIIIKRLHIALGYGKSLIEKLPSFYQKLRKDGCKLNIVATNHLTTPQQKLLQQYLICQGVPFFSFEHGVTAGINGTHAIIESENYSSYGDDFWVCYSESGLKVHTSEFGKQGGIAAGAPEVNKKINLQPLLRKILRKKLNINSKERVIVYVTSVTRNNLMTIATENDWEYYNVAKTIVYDVFRTLPDSCIVKLYPAKRYLDPDPLEQSTNIPRNVKIIKDIEFGLLRSLPDLIILNFSQSTLGWVWSTRVPVIFIEFPYEPFVYGLSKSFKQSILYIDGSQPSWAEELNKLLKLPHSELMKQWKDKEPERKKLEETHIFGPQGHSGKRAAEYILKTSREWYHSRI